MRHENVRGLDVAVNDVSTVRRIERIGDVDRQSDEGCDVDRLPANPLA